MLELKNLYKNFGNRVVLNDISLSVKSGEIALFLGGSGVGKSTLLRVLNNLETLDSGECILDGTSLDLHTIHQSHLIGMVFQEYYLFSHVNVQENITLPLTKVLGIPQVEATAIARTLLQEYGLLEKAHVPIHALSGGQKQRLAIARAIALKPRVLCLDEPTSALDPRLTNYIAHNIQQLAAQEYIVLVATHDTQLLAQLNCYIYLMQNGAIIESAHSSDLSLNSQAFPLLHSFIRGTNE